MSQWHAKAGDYQRQSDATNSSTRERKKKKLIRSIMTFVILLTVITIVGYFVIQHFIIKV